MRILIVEDEFIIAHSILSTLRGFDYEFLPVCSTFEEGLKSIIENKPELILLDVDLKGDRSGVDLAEVVDDKYKIPFIFLTSITDKHVLNALKFVNPSSILIKPFNTHELQATVSLLFHQEKKNNVKLEENSFLTKSLFVKQKSEYIRLYFSEILYIKSDDVYLSIETTNKGNLRIRGTLEAYSQKLSYEFERVHRSFIVNTDHIEKVFKEHLLIQSTIIPLGNKYKINLLNQLKIH